MLKTSLLTGFATIAAAAATATYADDSAGLYVGAGIGEAYNEVGEFDGNDTAFQIFGGYSFTKCFAIELAYVDAGTQRDRIEDIELANESSGIVVSGLAAIPLTEGFSIYGKLGYAFYDADATARRGNLQETERSSDDDLVYGIGVDLAVLRGFGLRAEWEIVDVSDGDFDIVTVNATYRF
jgi:opacity protein-like surface antigen